MPCVVEVDVVVRTVVGTDNKWGVIETFTVVVVGASVVVRFILYGIRVDMILVVVIYVVVGVVVVVIVVVVVDVLVVDVVIVVVVELVVLVVVVVAVVEVE